MVEREEGLSSGRKLAALLLMAAICWGVAYLVFRGATITMDWLASLFG